MRKGIAIHPAAHEYLESLGGNRHSNCLLENGNDPVLASGIFGIVIVHGRNGIAHEGWIIVEALLHHRVELGLSQTKTMFDGVATGIDGIL